MLVFVICQKKALLVQTKALCKCVESLFTVLLQHILSHQSFVWSSWISKGNVLCRIRLAASCCSSKLLSFFFPFSLFFFSPLPFVIIWNKPVRKCAIEAHHASTGEERKKRNIFRRRWNVNKSSTSIGSRYSLSNCQLCAFFFLNHSFKFVYESRCAWP